MLKRVFFRSEFESIPKTIKKVEVLDKLNGGYAAVYADTTKYVLVRDILGIVPLVFTKDPSFNFGDEKKKLIGSKEIRELCPRSVLIYKKKEFSFLKRPFFKLTPTNEKSKEDIIENLMDLMMRAVRDRSKPTNAVLFSGGIDSVLIAQILKELGREVHCFCTGVMDAGEKDPEDVIFAKKIAKKLKFPLTIVKIKKREVPDLIREIIPIIETNNVVKVGVGLTNYVAAKAAKEAGFKRIFSGLGSEEIFAGYNRHRDVSDVNKECIKGLHIMRERDTYRDYTIASKLKIQMVVPFCDRRLVDYSLKIPGKFKIKGRQLKHIIREVAKEFGIPKVYAERPKRAAQYGSNFDRAMTKFARQKKLKKQEWLDLISKTD